MSRNQHHYRHLDRDSKLTMELDLRQVAEQIEALNYGTQRFLSHLIDVRRERLAERVKKLAERGDADIAHAVRREGDRLAEGIAALLEQGLY